MLIKNIFLINNKRLLDTKKTKIYDKKKEIDDKYKKIYLNVLKKKKKQSKNTNNF